METAIRWSPSSTTTQQRFLVADVIGRTFRHCKVVDYDGKSLQWETITRHNKVPAFRAFDWSAFNEALVVVGQWSGETTILNLEGGTQVLSLPIKSQRQCNAVAFNSTGLLATGLERVRNDFSLNVFDINQRMRGSSGPGSIRNAPPVEPIRKLASSEGITSIKFFTGQPDTLVAGVKGTCVRVYDLRESTGSPALQNQTPCVHNIAIDPRDENYFASVGPARDSTIHIWDRRSTLRSTASNLGSSGSNTQDGPVLVLKNAFDNGRNTDQASLWSLRYCKGRSGCLGILTSTGEFKIIETKNDYSLTEEIKVDEHNSISGSAEPVEQRIYVHSAYDVEHPYYHQRHGREENERIVSFDFINLAGSRHKACAITLRSDRSIEISELHNQRPALAISSKSTILVTNMDNDRRDGGGEMSADTGCYMIQAKQSHIRTSLPTIHGSHREADDIPLTDISARPIINGFSSQRQRISESAGPSYQRPEHNHLFSSPASVNTKTISNALAVSALPRRRCAEGYLFDCTKNTDIIHGEASLQEMWRWVGRARAIAEDDGMISGQFDLSYLGVYTLWNNYLGLGRESRTLAQRENLSSVTQAIEKLCQRLHLPQLEMPQTSKLEHRKICLHSCGLCISDEDLETTVKDLVHCGKNTEAAFLAMMYGKTKLAFQALRNGHSREADRTLSIVIGAFSTGNMDDTWHEMIQDISIGVDDTYSKAILALVSNGQWSDVLKELSIPLRYRVGVALMSLDDEEVGIFIHEQTTVAIKSGAVDAVVLTGLHDNAMDLFEAYVSKSGDLQTAVLVMSFSVPRFVRSERFESWREDYRSMMNSWKMFTARTLFDMQSTKLATSADGSNLLLPPIPRQVTLRCNNCDQAMDRNPEHKSQVPPTTVSAGTHEGNIFGDKKSGTVCPRCGNHLPRCVVCDMWVGVPNPHTRGGAASAVRRAGPLETFPMVCQTCQHVFHGHHAQEWFSKHRVCPSPDCECPCASLDSAGGL